MIISIIIFFSLLLIVYLLIRLIYINIIKKYTRERFAFYGVSIMATLLSSMVLQVYSGQGYITAFLNLSNNFINTSFTTYETDAKDHIIMFFILSTFMVFIYRIYKNWDGPISELHYENIKLYLPSNIIKDFKVQLFDFLHKEKVLVVHNEQYQNNDYQIFLPTEDDKTPWYVNVYELLTYSSIQYDIDLEKDYYSEENVFISEYGQNKDAIAVFCCLHEPNESKIKKFLNFTAKQKRDFQKYIVAIKNDISESKSVKIQNIELIYRYQDEMLNNLVDFSSYHQFIKDQFLDKEITLGSKITLDKFYVELSAKTEENVEIPKVEHYINEWLQGENEKKHLAILGEYGCGKSVLSLKIAYELLNNRTNNSRIPILIELRGKSPRNLSMLEILSNWASNFRLDPSSLIKLHRAGKLLLIFEGFDEMDMIGDREMRLSHFQRIWEFAGIPKSKIIITGRPNFFLDDKELKVNLGIYRMLDSLPYCEAIYLEKFKLDQISHALRNVDINTKNQVLDLLINQKSSNFYDLVSRPAILYLVSVIWKERELSNYKDKINSAIIISEFIKYSYSRQSAKKANFPLTEKEREYFMLGVAIGMLKINELSNQINKVDLEAVILKLYQNVPDVISNATTATMPKRKKLKERMVDNNYSEETVFIDVRSCGILVHDLTRKDYFKFAHKSFLEYLVSLYYAETVIQNNGDYNIMVNAISSSLNFSPNELRHSPETIAFTAEILLTNLTIVNIDNHDEVCRKLYKVLSSNKLLSELPKLSSFLLVYLSSPFDKLIIMTGLTLLFFLFVFNNDAAFKNIEFMGNDLFKVFVLLVFFLTYIFFMRPILNKSSLMKAIRLPYMRRGLIWYKCCSQLNIPESIMLDVVTKNYLNIVKGTYTSTSLFDITNFLTNQLLLNRKQKIKDD